MQEYGSCKDLLPLFRQFAKLRKATGRIVTSVRPSVRIEQLGHHWANFRKL